MSDCIDGNLKAVSCATSTTPRRKPAKSPHQLRIETLFHWACLQASGASGPFRDPTLSRHDVIAAFTSWKITVPEHLQRAAVSRLIEGKTLKSVAEAEGIEVE